MAACSPSRDAIASVTSPRLLLDTNLLVLLVTGLTDVAYIGKNKRLASFDERDFEIVHALAGSAGAIVFSPNVLSETSNLIRYSWGSVRMEVSETLGRLTSAFGEEYVPTTSVLANPDFARLGVTDCVLLSQAATGAHLLTDDLDLYLASVGAGQAATNYNHIREARPDF